MPRTLAIVRNIDMFQPYGRARVEDTASTGHTVTVSSLYEGLYRYHISNNLLKLTMTLFNNNELIVLL